MYNDHSIRWAQAYIAAKKHSHAGTNGYYNLHRESGVFCFNDI